MSTKMKHVIGLRGYAIGKVGEDGFIPDTIATTKQLSAMRFRLYHPRQWRWIHQYQYVRVIIAESLK